MTARMRTALGVLATLAALTLAGGTSAAYTSPKLQVSYLAGNVTRIVASAAVTDDSTARAAILIPNGTMITATPAPGTKVGTARAQVSALALGGALLPLAGDIVVAPPGAVNQATQAQCTDGATPQATFLLVLQAAGQTINLPAYLTPAPANLAALGGTQLVFCLAPPDIPTTAGGATFGAKFLSADLTLTGVFSPLAQGTWFGVWTPWNPGVRTLNAAATAVSPAVIAPGLVTLSGRKLRGVKRLAGRVSQAGASIVTRVQILAGSKRIATVSSQGNGSFSYAVARGSKATAFRARAVVAARASAAVCGQIAPIGDPCVNGTINGFTAQSGTIRIR